MINPQLLIKHVWSTQISNREWKLKSIVAGACRNKRPTSPCCGNLCSVLSLLRCGKQFGVLAAFRWLGSVRSWRFLDLLGIAELIQNRAFVWLIAQPAKSAKLESSSWFILKLLLFDLSVDLMKKIVSAADIGKPTHGNLKINGKNDDVASADVLQQVRWWIPKKNVSSKEHFLKNILSCRSESLI